MKVLIDCGFHYGENITWFFSQKGSSEYKMYAFEPNYKLIKHLPEKSLNGRLEVINKAVSTFNGKRKFHIMENDLSSSFYEKKNETIKETVEVECIDLCEWIKENINEDDNVFLKLDIEGEEYKIVPKLMEQGLLGTYINELYVEFHQKKLRDKI